jgi:predicted  nucleic acid-binding Zn-ribbon protein
MFYCARCGARFKADSSALVVTCPRCETKEAVFAPFTSWMFDRAEPLDTERSAPTRLGGARLATDDRDRELHGAGGS